MIRFSHIKNPAGAIKYFTAAGRDYHIEDDRTYAFVAGKGAERLGMREFDFEQFKRMMHGLHPTENRKLTVGQQRENTRSGYELTMDGPKDLGVLVGPGGDGRVFGVLEMSVRETLDEIQKDAKCRVRVGKADHDRDTGNLVYFGVLHTTSRETNGKVDTQPHIHVLIPNATFDAVEGKWKALQLQSWATNGAKLDRAYYNAFFNARLAWHMRRLGYETEPTKDSFRVAGLSQDIRDEFSQRTKVIEETAKRLGITSAKVKSGLGAKTREKKKPGQTWASLVEHWRSRLTGEQLGLVEATVDSAKGPLPVQHQHPEHVQFALDHLLERKAAVPERAVATEALRHGIGHVTPEGVAAEIAGRDLVRGEVKGIRHVSTREVEAEELRIVAFAKEGRGKFERLGAGAGNRTPLLRPTLESVPLPDPAQGYPPGKDPATPRAFGQAVSVQGESRNPPLRVKAAANTTDLATLSPSQQAAIRHVWNSRDRLMLIRGAAGTGKTTLTRVALDGVNVPWVILAPSVDASRGVLREDGFKDADTLAAFFGSKDMQEKVRNGLIWLDEASLAGSKDIARLVQLADQLNARIVLSGDPRQHRSVVRGDVLNQLEREGIPVAVVSEVQRQKDKYREAAELMGAGKVLEGYRLLDKQGWIKKSSVVEEYFRLVDGKKDVLVVAPTHKEGESLTLAIREGLKKRGKLSGEEQTFTSLRNLGFTGAQLEEAKVHPPEGAKVKRYGVFAPEEIKLAKGDVIRATAGIKDKKGHRIDNGAVLTVTGFKDGIQVKTKTGAVRTLDADIGHIAHAYVRTTFAVQGRGEPNVLVAMPKATFGAVNEAAAYVAATRGKQTVAVFTDSKKELFDAIQRTDERILATDLAKQHRQRIRHRMKRHLTLVERAANFACDVLDKALNREITHER